MIATTFTKPIATATIEPIGARTSVPRDHVVKVTIKLNAIDAKYADKDHAASVARRSLEVFPTGRRGFGDVSVSSKGKTGKVSSVVVAVEGSVVWPARPADDSVDRLRAALFSEGYRVAVRGKRECAEPACMSDAMVDWDGPFDVPSGWYSNVICGRHSYRTCSKCESIYVLTSENSASQAPSLHCEVCGVVMVEWGSSKIWSAELITRREALS